MVASSKKLRLQKLGDLCIEASFGNAHAASRSPAYLE